MKPHKELYRHGGLPAPNPATEEPFSADEVPTHPQLVTHEGVDRERERLFELFASHEREIVRKICDSDHIDPRFLDKIREAHFGGRMMFAEYYCKLARVGYIYFDSEFEGELAPDRRRHVPVKAHGRSVLLRVKDKRHVGPIYEWPEN